MGKQETSTALVNNSVPSFLLRFSDTQTGAISIAFVCNDDDVKGEEVGTKL